MGKRIVMAVVAALGLCASALADTPDTGMKNYDPASINSSASSNTETNFGTPAPATADGKPTQRTTAPGTSYSGTSRTTATRPTLRDTADHSQRVRRHRGKAAPGRHAPHTNSDVLGTGAPR